MNRPLKLSSLAIVLFVGCENAATNRTPYAQPMSPYNNGTYGYGPVVGSPMFVTMPQSGGGPAGGMTPLGMAPRPMMAMQPTNVPPQQMAQAPMPPTAPVYQPQRVPLALPAPAPAAQVATSAPSSPTSFWPPQGAAQGVVTYPTASSAPSYPPAPSYSNVAAPMNPTQGAPYSAAPVMAHEPVPTPAVRPHAMAQLPTPAAIPAYQPYSGSPSAPTAAR